MENTNKTTSLIITLLLALSISNMACAVSIGAGPSTIFFNRVLKGGYAEDYFSVATSGGENLSCTINVTGAVSDWMTFDSKDHFQLISGEIKRVKVIMRPPIEISNGEYNGKIRVIAAPTAQVESGAGMAVGAGVEINVRAIVVGDQVASIQISNFQIGNTEVGFPSDASITLINDGNVYLNPRLYLNILDETGATILKTVEFQITDVKPTEHRDTSFEVNMSGVSVGDHGVNLTVHATEGLDKYATGQFKIFPEGTWPLNGTLKDLMVSSKKIDLGNTVKISGVFKSLTPKKTKVQLIGEVYSNDQIVKTFESKSSNVAPKGEATLETYFTPEKTGKYLIKAYVQYGEEQETQTEAASLEVVGKQQNYLLYGVILLVVILIAVAAYFKFIRKPM